MRRVRAAGRAAGRLRRGLLQCLHPMGAGPSASDSRTARPAQGRGVLAVQTPMNYEEPIHRIIGGIVHSPAFADKLPQQREFYNLTPPEYWELLHAHASAFRMWKVTYMHTLPSHEAVMDWYRGTGMRPYLQALDDAGRKKFEAEVFAQVREEYPTQSDGSIIFPFPRFFFLATR
ncbi:hypothetical protein BLIG_01884 [Bifidobacterium longum subsp. infantis CCUG 52486]|uniref:Trans-aconitate 2-methyltransferase n=1 Tax=Bifidobacterium longum subsp. infantis CCUG 52486 TaxID=537937 RepID=C5EDX1_BIFLI|nr:hypothetical protein BLIG_01884 [Bifidobacterium longum subsp. infantis CCUG 52486]